VSGLTTRVFAHDELVLVLPPRHRLATPRSPIAFADTLGEEWIGLNSGAALLQQLQQAALAARRPLRLRMQVRSFDAVCHMVSSGLGIAVLPRAAALPIVRAMKLSLRPLLDAWAKRRLLLATPPGVADAGVATLADFLVESSQNAKPRRSKQE
jgi:DNA-binding transcriptional LysR family regulator